MKKNILFAFLLGAISFLVGCETLDEPKVEVTSIYPLSGQWVIRFIKPNPTTIADTTIFTSSNLTSVTSSTYGDIMNSKDSDWIKLSGPLGFMKSFTVKASCNVTDGSFKIVSGRNNIFSNGVSVGKITISDGKVIANGWTTLSGHKSDKITFKIEDSRTPGVIYTAEGFRKTGWWEDEPH